MNKTTMFLLLAWIVLAILNIIGVFKVCTFLIICSHVFAFYNALMVLALVPEVWRFFFKKQPKVEEYIEETE